MLRSIGLNSCLSGTGSHGNQPQPVAGEFVGISASTGPSHFQTVVMAVMEAFLETSTLNPRVHRTSIGSCADLGRVKNIVCLNSFAYW